MTHSNSSALYGLWPSPLQPRHVAEGLRLSDVAWDSDGTTLVWHEGRSDRGVLVCLPPGGDAPRDITTDLSVRARVGYGGGDFSVSGGDVYFVEASGRLYRQSLSAGPATALTPAFGYAAAPAVSPQRQWVVFVHTYEGHRTVWPWSIRRVGGGRGGSSSGLIFTCSPAGIHRTSGWPGWPGGGAMWMIR